MSVIDDNNHQLETDDKKVNKVIADEKEKLGEYGEKEAS